MKKCFVSWMAVILFCGNVQLSLQTAQAKSGNEKAAPFATSQNESVLLLGEPTVARTAHLTQRYFPVQRHPANPVIKRAEPWEGVGPYLWGNRLMQDEKTKELRLWYIAYR